jgi:tyrosine-specific transport protein
LRCHPVYSAAICFFIKQLVTNNSNEDIVMQSKLLGGILLVVGTTIGAGMLALPIGTAELGFWGSLVLLIGSWAIMTTCAFLFLEVNLWLPAGTNLISMAGATLGRGGRYVAWVFYLLLLYSILSAYIAGGGDLLHYIILNVLGIQTPTAFGAFLFTFLLGSVVYLGIHFVDYVNRGLMFGKMGAFCLLVLLIMPFVTGVNLGSGEFKHIMAPSSITVTVVAFTCAMIIPSLRTYYGEDVKTLRKAIFIGTLIPLICYIAWDMVIMGVIPLNGQPSLEAIMHSSTTTSDLVSALTVLLHKNTVTMLANFFTSICMATSFLSIALSLSDFLSDGLRIVKKGTGKWIVFAITFVPPVVLVVFYPDAFLKGIQYAGISCLILMMLFPPLMAWRGRYKLALPTGSFEVGGGKALLVVLTLSAVVMIAFCAASLIG